MSKSLIGEVAEYIRFVQRGNWMKQVIMTNSNVLDLDAVCHPLV